jgi:hypothetical protein
MSRRRSGDWTGGDDTVARDKKIDYELRCDFRPVQGECPFQEGISPGIRDAERDGNRAEAFEETP